MLVGALRVFPRTVLPRHRPKSSMRQTGADSPAPSQTVHWTVCVPLWRERAGSGPRGRGFESRHSDHKPVTKKMSQAYFFAVSSKNGDFANRFLDTVLQCCPTILGRFAHLDSHFSADFWNLAGEGAIFFEKKQNKSCCFQNVFNFPAANFSVGCGDFLLFLAVFSFFSGFPFYTYYNKEDFHYEHHYRY